MMTSISLRLLQAFGEDPSSSTPKPKSRLRGDILLRRSRVLDISQTPGWMQWDPYIRHGYRAQLNSFPKCFWSLFYLHNESINTWSHILPGIYFLALLLAIDHWALQFPFQVPLPDLLAIQAYVAGTAGCLIFSAAFHATSAHSPEVAAAFLKLDYLGIILTISTTCVSVTYFAMYSNPMLQAIYISFTTLSALLVFWIALDPRMDGPRAGPWRAAIFILLATSGLIPIFHLIYLESTQGLFRVPIDSLTVTCTFYAIGTAAYVTRFPEKYCPKRFDLFGASHQIFHVLVAFGQIVHLYGLKMVLARIHLGVCEV